MKKKEPLKIVISHIIEREILSGIWKEGVLLPSEIKLCERFNVSRITIRAAIQILETRGFVKSIKGKGTKVISSNPNTTLNFNSFTSDSPTNEDILAVIELRKVFEKGITGIAAERITDLEIKELEKVYKNMISNAGNIDEFSKTDFQFHILLGTATKNPFIIKTYKSMQTYLSNTMEHIVSIRGSAAGIRYHKQLLEALKAHDKTRAEQIMEEHIQDTIDAIAIFYSEHEKEDL